MEVNPVDEWLAHLEIADEILALLADGKPRSVAELGTALNNRGVAISEDLLVRVLNHEARRYVRLDVVTNEYSSTLKRGNSRIATANGDKRSVENEISNQIRAR